MSLDVNISEPDEFNCVELHSSLEEFAKILGISDFEYHVDHISGGGRDNYIAHIFRVVIRDTVTNNSENVIVKTLVNTARQELFHDLHTREVDVYKYVMPKFRELQGHLEVNQRISLPECLHYSKEKSKEVIFLNDLNEIGFTQDNTLSNFGELDLQKVQLVLTQLAKFHSLSFVLENQMNDEFSRIKQNFEDILFTDKFLSKSKLRNYFFESFDTSVNLVKDTEAKKKLEMVRPKLLELLKIGHEPSEYNVFCHGDLWINNILFKEENVCFLDFQAMRYASPATDIIYFIYLCTTSQFRSENFSNLLSTYYDSLNSALKLYDIDVNVVYPREDFERDIKDKQPFGLLMALIELRIITTTPEDDAIMKGAGMEPESSLTEVPGEIELFRIRVNDLVQECVDNGVLEQLVAKINV